MCFADYDGDYEWAQLVWAHKRARKTHCCDACCRPIVARETYRYSKGVYDGSFYIQRRCLRCDLIAQAMSKRGCEINFDLTDPIEGDGEYAWIERHATIIPDDTEPVCALVFLTQAELEARA